MTKLWQNRMVHRIALVFIPLRLRSLNRRFTHDQEVSSMLFIAAGRRSAPCVVPGMPGRSPKPCGVGKRDLLRY